jgi:hypothetical protein
MNKQQKLEKLNFLIKEFEAILPIEIKRDQSIESIINQVVSTLENENRDFNLNVIDILRLNTLLNEMEDLNESI